MESVITIFSFLFSLSILAMATVSIVFGIASIVKYAKAPEGQKPLPTLILGIVGLVCSALAIILLIVLAVGALMGLLFGF